jgi:branched-chain amino acid aminotransferase
MLAFLNGQFLPEEQARVSVLDRGFLYGDGVFETIRVANANPFQWPEHFERLERGAARLRIKLPCSNEELGQAALHLIAENGVTEAALRIALSRGPGPRGYSIKGADHPTLAMTLHAAPKLDPDHPRLWNVVTTAVRLPPKDPLSEIKSGNKLPHILARAEAESRGADEGLLLNGAGDPIETSSANLFWLERDTVCTPGVESGILPGITRAWVLDWCRQARVEVREKTVRSSQLSRADGIFATNSILGIVEIQQLDETRAARAALSGRLQRAWLGALNA